MSGAAHAPVELEGRSNNAPIGVFDSGVGGLDVTAELSLQLPNERFVYLGDTARVPYGTRTPDEVKRFSHEALDALIKLGVKAVVLACNTASALALEELQERSPIPVLGMVEAGVEAALKAREEMSPREPSGVLILATPRTIDSQAYQQALTSSLKAEQRALAPLHALACPMFVPLVEAGWTDCEVSELVAAKHLQELIGAHGERLREEVGLALLGCTHYPLLSASISKGFERVLGRPLRLVDGAQRVAEQLREVLTSRGELARSSALPPQHVIYTTAPPERTRGLAERFWRARLGQPLPALLPFPYELSAPPKDPNRDPNRDLNREPFKEAREVCS